MEGGEHNDLTLSEESIEALKAHKRRLDDDIAAGRFNPGDRRCVTLPNGDRFYIGHPDDGAAIAKTKKRSWWRHLIGR
ncbi:hypothetical protein [Vreelandella massiliensis]|uniref:hypothetical protein n=1 Tax=Vreelandella massiliensis TaxID=1816686 RepID=UPI00096A8C68|nr:hypothetical protein [Halomonas massiliensis]